MIPQPEFGRVPGPHSSHQPASSSRNGATQRIVPNHGEKTPVHQLVKAPSPGSVRAMSVIAPSTSSVSPMIERTTSGVRRAVSVERVFGRAAPATRVWLACEPSIDGGSPRQTSTTTGKTIGRRFVCSYR